MSIVRLDAETRSREPLAHGHDRYFRAPGAEARSIIWTWAVDDHPVQLWDILGGRGDRAEFEHYVCDPANTLVAHNASFDYAAALYGTGIETDPTRWRCTRAQAYSAGLPGALDLLGAVLGIPLTSQKLAGGKNLIQLFCVPHEGGRFYGPDDLPSEWEQFCQYAVRDTEALRAIHKILPTHNYRGKDLAWYHFDQLSNWRGFRFDKQLATAARSLLDRAKAESSTAISTATGGSVTAATQRAKLLDFLNRKYGLEIANLQKATITEMLEQDDLDPGLRFLLETRLEAAKASGAKYGRGLTLVGAQDRIRHSHQCFGAGRTGRDSHKGYQPGNMARPSQPAEYIDSVVIPYILSGGGDPVESLLVGGPNTACANALRGGIIAAPGNTLIDADYSNVESRILAWLSGQSATLRLYETGADLYKLWFSEKFRIPIDEVTKHQRQIAKVVALSMGFLGGVGAFVPMAAGYDLDLDTLPDLVLPRATAAQLKKAEKAWGRAFLAGEDFDLEPPVYMACDVLKQAYREGNSAIFSTGHEVGNLVIKALRNPGVGYEIAKCKIWNTGKTLIIEIPDGSRLTYISPQLHETKYTDPETGKESVRYHTSFMTARGKQWFRNTAWAGLYWENIVQATANRLLRAAALRIHADTLTVPAIKAYLDRLPAHARTAIVLRIHDSLTLDVPVGSYSLERMIEQMNILPAWAAGFPVATEGWVNVRYGSR